MSKIGKSFDYLKKKEAGQVVTYNLMEKACLEIRANANSTVPVQLFLDKRYRVTNCQSNTRCSASIEEAVKKKSSKF